jgi:hypothetical protein
MKLLNWLKGFLSENGEASSKRFVGVFSAIALCWTLYANHDAVNEHWFIQLLLCLRLP